MICPVSLLTENEVGLFSASAVSCFGGAALETDNSEADAVPDVAGEANGLASELAGRIGLEFDRLISLNEGAVETVVTEAVADEELGEVASLSLLEVALEG